MAAYDYRCPQGHVFEARNSVADRATAPCPCGEMGKHVILTAPILDPKMGVDPAFATMAAKWDRKQIRKATGQMRDSNNTAHGTNHDVERDAHRAKQYYNS